MSRLDARIQEIRDNQEGTYYRGLVENTGGLVNAAVTDMVIDGDYTYLDLRRSPFAGDEDLKALARAAKEAQDDLRGALITVAWKPRGTE